MLYLTFSFIGYVAIIYTDMANPSFIYNTLAPLLAVLYTWFLIWVPARFLARNGLTGRDGSGIHAFIGIFPAFIEELSDNHANSFGKLGILGEFLTTIAICAEIYFGVSTYLIHFRSIIDALKYA